MLFIVLDEDIKGIFTQCEEELSYLRDVFKRYQEKNKRKVKYHKLSNIMMIGVSEGTREQIEEYRFAEEESQSAAG